MSTLLVSKVAALFRALNAFSWGVLWWLSDRSARAQAKREAEIQSATHNAFTRGLTGRREGRA